MTHFNDHNHNLNEVNFDSLFLYLRARLRKRDDPGRIVNHFKIIIGMLTMPLRGVFFRNIISENNYRHKRPQKIRCFANTVLRAFLDFNRDWNLTKTLHKGIVYIL